MKTTIATKALTEALTRTKIVCGTRTTLPVLTCVRLSVGVGEIKIDATDLDTFLSVTVPADSTEAGECVVACNRLLDGVKQAGESVELSAEKEHLQLKFDGSVMRLRTLHPDEFPKWPGAEVGEKAKVDAAALSTLIARAMPFVAPDESVLRGVFVEKNGTGINAVGCDRKSLIAIHDEGIKEWGEGVIILPGVARLLTAFDGEISVQVTENYIWIRGIDRCLASKLLVDKYPDWKRVIPDSTRANIKITADRESLLRAVRVAAITTMWESDPIVIEAAKGEIAVKSQSADSDSSASKLPAKVSERCTITVSARRLIAMLGAHSGEDFTLQIEDAMSPVLIEGDGLQMTMTQTRTK